MAVINMLPQNIGGGIKIKGFDTFKWLDDGIIDASESIGTIVGNGESNARNNLATIEEDGYLRIYNTNSAYGRMMMSTENTIGAGTYDFVLFHIKQANYVNAQVPQVGLKTAKNAGIPTYPFAVTYLTEKWFAYPLANLNQETGTNYYLAFGGTTDLRIDKIYFLKVKE